MSDVKDIFKQSTKEAGERLLKLTSDWEKDLSKVSKEEMVVLVKYAAQEMVRRWNMYRDRFEQKDIGQMWEVADVKSEYCESDGLTKESYKLKNGDEEKWVDVRTYLSLLDLGLIKTGIKVMGMLGSEVNNSCEKEELGTGRGTSREKKFKIDDRVWHESMGYGTVTTATYYNSRSTTYTCVKYDNFLGIKDSLCCETDELTLVND
ncbi:hypothetical protein [Bacillus sp. 1006-3]|uniref:hypothetical protein n=1 Tax=Bacillus sp. 1006-3 TaxID=2922309 RepID=UPI001F0D1861|nr:hypothetical protein [Bacillus sp. 1006-3]MCH4866663.1 hypothetical protein [Bacillus sp. 1006-3]